MTPAHVACGDPEAYAQRPLTRSPSLDAARGARCCGARNARVTVVGEHLRSRAVGKVRGQPRGRRPEADQPGDGTVGLTQQLADLEDGTDVHLVAAELLRRQQPEEPGRGHSVNDRVRGLPFGVTRRRVLAQQRLQCASP
jgi:hypothetical protein